MYQTKSVTKQKGFTMIEVLIGMAIASVIILGFVTVSNMSSRSQNFIATRLHEIHETRKSFTVINEEIKYGVNFSISDNNDILTYNDTNNNLCTLFRGSSDSLLKLRRQDSEFILSPYPIDNLIFTYNDSSYRTININIDIDGQHLETTVRSLNFGTNN